MLSIARKAVKYVGLVSIGLLVSCGSDSEMSFVKIAPKDSGILFTNTVVENDSVNMIDYSYLYNGGGVAAADLNNDGLPELFFTANQTTSRLYINRGGMKFDDITEQAGVQTDGWCTGVTFADINADGLLDIYICRSGNTSAGFRKNLLYINQGIDNTGIPHFIEKAQEVGLADEGFSTQAAFFDYDKDGDLDVYVMNATNYDRNPNRIKPIQKDGNSIANDHLYRNDSKDGKMIFVENAKNAHILDDAWGLGLSISDVNNDGWEDIFVSNDFLANDLLYINNHDGTFTEQSPKAFGHTSQFSMGNDIADINNDGWKDIMTADMLPFEDNKRKRMAGTWTFETFQMATENGYTPQYMRNTLQLNNGVDKNGALYFSEIGQLAGVYATDWSWSPMLADLDNDGWRDLFISNGYRHDITDLDFISYNAEAQFSDAKIKDLAKKQPDYKTLNRVFRNNQDLTFQDKTLDWGIDEPTFSNGAITVDLDNDGDLDIVTNNIDEPAGIYLNKAPKETSRNFLKIQLKGNGQNTFELGAEIELFINGQKQVYHHSVTRGYQSSTDYVIHFGLGASAMVDSLKIRWSDGSVLTKTKITANQTLLVKKEQAFDLQLNPAWLKTTPNEELVIGDTEISYNDYSREPFLPHQYANQTPKMTHGDINADGLEDVYVCGGIGANGTLLIQQKDGNFIAHKIRSVANNKEEADALLFDADGDHDLDLYLAMGSTENPAGSKEYQDELWLNDGKGHFVLAENRLPVETESASCVRAADFDADGDLDLFVGTRRQVGDYPVAGKSMLLRNDKGIFRNITPPFLQQIGLVTDAQWQDTNHDSYPELFIVGEFMPITICENTKGILSPKVMDKTFSDKKGFWNCIKLADIDQDGNWDIIVGNIGLNNRYHIDTQNPVKVYWGDFDNNGRKEPLTTYFINGKERLAHSRDELTRQLNGFRKQFPNYASYAQVDCHAIVDKAETLVSEVNFAASCWLKNQGDGTYQWIPLPKIAQIAPVKDMLLTDTNADGWLDILLVGNEYGTETSLGQNDASVGITLLGSKQGFRALLPTQNPIKIQGDARGIVSVKNPNKKNTILVSKHKGLVQIIRE